jgi:hypothetical protein
MTNWTHEDLLAAARAMRGQLPSLVADHQVKEFDQQLATLLAKDKAGNDIKLDLIDALTTETTLRQWTNEFLLERRPPQANLTRSGELTNVVVGPVVFERYSCPQGDYDWFRFAPGDRIPHCPTHHAALICCLDAVRD